jgi:PIN domain
MPKTVKIPDLSAAVVWDTNPLFSESEIELVSSQSLTELREIQQTAGIEILIPRVVAGEILFRKDWGLANLRNDAAKKLTSIGLLVSSPQPDVANQKTLRRRLQRRFIKWCKANHIRLWRVPFDKVNWRRLVSLAMSRQPPFSPFDPKGKSEKGFRDALILETLCDVYQSIPAKPTVFICGDELLANAAKARLGPDRLSVYKTSTEYLSYLKLQRQNFVNETIKAILEEATALFYTANSPESIYTKFDIPAKLHSSLPAEFSKTPPPTPFLVSPLQPESFKAVTAEGYGIGPTNIETASDNNQMTFKTEVAAAQAFQSSNQYASEQLRVISAVVFWTAKWQVLPHIELSSPQFRSIKWEKTTFEMATDERLKSFNLPTLLDRLLASFKSAPPGAQS